MALTLKDSSMSQGHSFSRDNLAEGKKANGKNKLMLKTQEKITN